MLQAELDTTAARLEELREEHGDEEGALNEVSNKADALRASSQALVAVWNEDDKAACASYMRLIEQAEEQAVQLRTLTDHHHISVLKNKKGSVALKSIKDQLAKTDDTAESETLSDYLEADKLQKAKSKQAKTMLTEADAQYREKLTNEPLPENLVDFHATVQFLQLLDEQSSLKSQIKEADAALDKLAYEKYPQLSVDEIKTLVVDDKWLVEERCSISRNLGWKIWS